ncbi:hypothetical protein TNCT_313861 [Trichonephila clavata]|uniref:Uncharacterized protein n=1 Tax=Trichonephila clavata TaxID=2740835 RepID=A0A8X6J5X8_TRICU|nr:hypothetical protein TNCT_313861 [Trichonephila clavata]
MPRRFLNMVGDLVLTASSLKSRDIYRQICEVYGDNAMIKWSSALICEIVQERSWEISTTNRTLVVHLLSDHDLVETVETQVYTSPPFSEDFPV